MEKVPCDPTVIAWYCFAPMGPTPCARLEDPYGSLNARAWPQGALSAVPGPRSDRCCCSAIAVWPTCRSRWDAAMGPSLGGPLHDPYGGLDAESRPQGTVSGGAAPIAKPDNLIRCTYYSITILSDVHTTV